MDFPDSWTNVGQEKRNNHPNTLIKTKGKGFPQIAKPVFKDKHS